MKIKTKIALILFFRGSDVEPLRYVDCLSGDHGFGCILHGLTPCSAHLLQSNQDPIWMVSRFGVDEPSTLKSEQTAVGTAVGP